MRYRRRGRREGGAVGAQLLQGAVLAAHLLLAGVVVLLALQLRDAQGARRRLAGTAAARSPAASAARRPTARPEPALAARVLRRLDRLEALAGHLERRPEDPWETFRGLQRRYDGSMLLIHSRFDYVVHDLPGRERRREGHGWGSGFVVSRQGHVITNKHVVQPWKFDAEICTRAALGELTVVEDSLELSAWPAGTRCEEPDGTLSARTGFHTGGRGGLRLVHAAPDTMVQEWHETARLKLAYRVHALDDNDLAVLRADNLGLTPVPCAAGVSRVSKLDRVMLLGFPRGRDGLERGIAETSPSLGTVRKVEDTITVTAPMVPGNSGGPVFDAAGEVVGVATRTWSETLGICIKIEHALRLLAEVRGDR